MGVDTSQSPFQTPQGMSNNPAPSVPETKSLPATPAASEQQAHTQGVIMQTTAKSKNVERSRSGAKVFIFFFVIVLGLVGFLAYSFFLAPQPGTTDNNQNTDSTQFTSDTITLTETSQTSNIITVSGSFESTIVGFDFVIPEELGEGQLTGTYIAAGQLYCTGENIIFGPNMLTVFMIKGSPLCTWTEILEPTETEEVLSKNEKIFTMNTYELENSKKKVTADFFRDDIIIRLSATELDEDGVTEVKNNIIKLVQSGTIAD